MILCKLIYYIRYDYYNHAHSIYRGHAHYKQRVVTCAVNNTDTQLDYNIFLYVILYIHKYRCLRIIIDRTLIIAIGMKNLMLLSMSKVLK